ncbi:fungal-specific transcription factor domain-containing protein [Penicillium digitatum]|uniref:Uncharacterized protein n=3 Tax=Penicillium digitatum TaxID=36651 RepID=K9GAE1_PEND2|nr:hypothetical protein PDIP_38420 [Penicillium digitatum Pd1]EKV15859.1 hypothetical protein PDIP_38420 [Penicillium digitatum Pd1]EKV18049.1 hypothetical protein PDIG_12200 [Penicillium digitatum PHI26]KAG0153637.1 hypothetical protein PDIDSM_2291 [Penicillium digitatum]QQK42360.1 fungal-specific transcription factor domain-containing protein [Penicillium digitatum]
MPFEKPFGSLTGATHLTRFAITQTEKLAEAIESYEPDNLPVPEYLTAGIAQLSKHLQLIQPKEGIPLSLQAGIDAEDILFNNFEVAWFLSAYVYYHNRLLKIFDDDLVVAVDEILACMLRAEEIKALLQPDLIHRSDPITFPAFVAACNATNRQPWIELWRSMQHYGLPNVESQWTTIKTIWNILDDTKALGGTDLNWVTILQGPDEIPLSLPTLYERFCF